MCFKDLTWVPVCVLMVKCLNSARFWVHGFEICYLEFNTKDRWDSRKPAAHKLFYVISKLIYYRAKYNDHYFDISRSLKAKSDNAVGSPICALLLVFNY